MSSDAARSDGARDLYALPALLTVAETAEFLRVGRSWVYEHAAELGAVKLGSGQPAPLRIPLTGCDGSRHAFTAARAAVGALPRPRLLALAATAS